MQTDVRGIVRSSENIEESELEGGARIRWLITHRDGAPTFSMRLITVENGKSTPYHSHDYEHEIYVISGKLSVLIGKESFAANQGDHIFIPPNEFHGMSAVTDTTIICVVPIRAAHAAFGD
ncbi:cupin 2 domain-containing protein [mine drainage metagenome]|uniref:Cupin 2 domain-containing protein n=1 Tax=mine drainage metagenome TaxID=410659 RepID=T0YPN6_9ZZZZ